MFAIRNNNKSTIKEQEELNKQYNEEQIKEKIHEEMQRMIEANMNSTPLVTPGEKFDDDPRLDFMQQVNITSEPLNVFQRFMMGLHEDAGKAGDSNMYHSLNYSVIYLYKKQLYDYLIETTYINFCNMVDQVTYIASDKFKAVLNSIPLKQSIYDTLHTDSLDSETSVIRSIINNFFSNPCSPGNMVVHDTLKENPHAAADCAMLCEYTGNLLAVAFYHLLCHSTQNAVDFVYLNVYQTANYDMKLKKAAEALEMNCDPQILPMYVSNAIKQYLLMNINTLIKFLENTAYIPVINNTFGSGYFNFALTRECMNNKEMVRYNGGHPQVVPVPAPFPDNFPYDDAIC